MPPTCSDDFDIDRFTTITPVTPPPIETQDGQGNGQDGLNDVQDGQDEAQDGQDEMHDGPDEVLDGNANAQEGRVWGRGGPGGVGGVPGEVGDGPGRIPGGLIIDSVKGFRTIKISVLETHYRVSQVCDTMSKNLLFIHRIIQFIENPIGFWTPRNTFVQTLYTESYFFAVNYNSV